MLGNRRRSIVRRVDGTSGRRQRDSAQRPRRGNRGATGARPRRPVYEVRERGRDLGTDLLRLRVVLQHPGFSSMNGDFEQSAEPFTLFAEWLKAAEARNPTIRTRWRSPPWTATGCPNVRMVLLKGHGEDGFVFFTNLESAKGKELPPIPRRRCASTGRASEGRCGSAGRSTVVSADEADAYFASRPRGSRIGAWASQQSRPLESRFALEKAVAAYTARYAIGDVPRPDYWSGFRVDPAGDRVLVRRAPSASTTASGSRAMARAGRRRGFTHRAYRSAGSSSFGCSSATTAVSALSGWASRFGGDERGRGRLAAS